MLEKLIEGWLDSVNERGYQAVFCQMLAAHGHTVLHSTRHMPIEFGKDVISIDPEGNTCAFQLKGNPGTRMSLTEFRQIQAQLFELVTQQIVYPGLKRRWHKSYIVTNGYFEEEVISAISNMNNSFRSGGIREDALIQTMSRGDLLRWASDLGAALWPDDIGDLNSILKLLVWNGQSSLPVEMFDQIFQKILGLGEGGKTFPAVKLKRAIHSAAVFTGVALRQFTLERSAIRLTHIRN